MSGVDGRQTIDLNELIPDEGDAVVLINHGTHVEVIQHRVVPGRLALTDEEVEAIRQGRVNFH